MRRFSGILLPIVIVGLLIGAVVGGLWAFMPHETPFYTDAEGIEESMDTARIRDVLWTPPIAVGQPINSPVDEYEARVSVDGATMYFVRGRAGGDAEIWFAERQGDGWTDPAPFEAANSSYDDLGPQPSPDGDTVYFYSDRPGGFGGYDLWRVRRDDGVWSAAENLGEGVNSPLNDYGAAMTPDGRSLYFASNRPTADELGDLDPEAWAATIREDPFARHYDMYKAAATPRGFGDAQYLEHLSTPFDEGSPAISPVGDFLYFASNRPGGTGGFDLYRGRLLKGQVEDIESLGESVNTARNELDPALSMGGFRLHFSSDRLQDDGESEKHQYDVYFADSREVFRTVRVSQARYDFLTTLLTALPWLLALLLLLLLLALLRRAAVNPVWQRRWKTLSLMAKCLLISLLAHILLAALLTAWQVTTSLEGLLDRDGGNRVTLVSNSIGNDIVSQLRVTSSGAMFDVEVPSESPRAPRLSGSVSDEMQSVSPEAAERSPERSGALTSLNESVSDDIAEPKKSDLTSSESDAAVSLPKSRTLDQVAEAGAAIHPSDPLAPAAEVRPSVRVNSEVELAPESLRLPRAQGSTLLAASEIDDARPMIEPAVTQSSAATPAWQSESAVRMPRAGNIDSVEEARVMPESLEISTETPTAAAVGGGAASRPKPVESSATVQGIGPRASRFTEVEDASPQGSERVEAWAPETSQVSSVRLPTGRIAGQASEVPSGAPGIEEVDAPAGRGSSLAANSSERADLTPDSIAVPRPQSASQFEDAAESAASTALTMAAPRVFEQTVPEAGASVRLPSVSREQQVDVEIPSKRASPSMLSEPSAAVVPLTVSDAAGVSMAPERARRDEAALGLSPEIDDLAVGSLATSSVTIRLPEANDESTTVVRLPRQERREAPKGEDASDVTDVVRRSAIESAVPVVTGLAAPDAAVRFDPPPLRGERAITSSAAAERPDRTGVSGETPGVSRQLTLGPIAVQFAVPSSEAPPPEMRLYGLVVDGSTGDGLPGATVRLDLEPPATLETLTDRTGGFEILPMEVPDHVAVVAFREGYEASAANVSRADLRKGARLVFVLFPESAMVIALEENPVVHHLGNDEFTGRINSQFQKDSEGLSYRRGFRMVGIQSPDRLERVTLRLLVKGAQISNEIRINGRVLTSRLSDSPDDGSFGEFSIGIPLGLLRKGENRLEIRSIREQDTDYDDFEFTNVRLELEAGEGAPL